MLTRRQENKKRVFEMLAQGIPQKDIPAVLGLTPGAVSRIISRHKENGVDGLEFFNSRHQSAIAQAILSLLKAKGWTQGKLAEELGVSERSVQRWLKGDSEPGGATLKLLEILKGQ